MTAPATTSPDPATLDAAVAAAEARVMNLTADHARQVEALAGVMDALTQARVDAERARGRRHLAGLRAILGGR